MKKKIFLRKKSKQAYYIRLGLYKNKKFQKNLKKKISGKFVCFSVFL